AFGCTGWHRAHPTKRLRKPGSFRRANRHRDPIVALGQSPPHGRAENPRAAIDGDQSVIRTACGHAALNFAGRGCLEPGQYRIGPGLYRPKGPSLTSLRWLRIWSRQAQVAELVDALVSGTSGESRGGSSPLLGTNV